MTHPRHELDELLLNPVRLSLLSALASADSIDFSQMQADLEVTASALSKANTALEDAGYITVSKGFVGKKPRTWLQITPTGRATLTRHRNALISIAGN